MTDRDGICLDRLRSGEWLFGLAALALLIDLLGLPWYSLRAQFRVTSAEFGAATSATGFQAHDVIGPLLIMGALLAIATWLSQATSRAPALPLVLTVVLAVLMFVLSIVVTVRVVFDPPAVLLTGAPGVDTIRTDVPAVVGVFLAWAIFAGAWLSLRTDGIADGDAPRHIEVLRLAQRPA